MHWGVFLVFFMFLKPIHPWWIPKPRSPSKIITISPSGLHGYYLLGIISYLKQHYDLSNFVFSGASAGSWISLIMSYKGNHKEIIKDVLDVSERSKKNVKTLGHGLRDLFLKSGKYRIEDFDTSRCYMGLIDVKRGRTLIYSKFHSLEDAIYCCIASSHVPFIMGQGLRKYRDLYAIDGGFSGNPYHGNCHLDGDYSAAQTDQDCSRSPASLHIDPFIWYNRNITKIEFYMNQFKLFLDLFQIDRMNFHELYELGYKDAKLRWGPKPPEWL